MSRFRAPPALAVLVAVLLCGCSHVQTIGHRRVLQVDLTEYRITPEDVHGSAGPLTIFVHNFGRLAHDLSISRDGQPQATTRAIPPGQSAELTVTVSPGTYQMASTVLSDEALGAYGTLQISR